MIRKIIQYFCKHDFKEDGFISTQGFTSRTCSKCKKREYYWI